MTDVPQNKDKGEGRRRSRLIGMQLRLMSRGESMTFSQTIRAMPDSRAMSKLAQLIGGYATRHRPKAQWSYEGFTSITGQGRPIVGVVITLVAEADSKAMGPRSPSASDTPRVGEGEP